MSVFLLQAIDLSCWIFIQRSSSVSYSSSSSCCPDFVSVFSAAERAPRRRRRRPPPRHRFLLQIWRERLRRPRPNLGRPPPSLPGPKAARPCPALPPPGPLLFLRSLDLGGRERELKLIGVAWATEEKEDGAGTSKWHAGTDGSPPPDFRRLKYRRSVKTNGCILKIFSLLPAYLTYFT